MTDLRSHISYPALILSLVLGLLSLMIQTSYAGPAISQSKDLNIKTKPYSKIDHNIIFLNDIAKIHCDDPHLLSQLQTITLGSSPRLGLEKKIPGSYLVSVIKNKRFVPDGIHIDVPEIITVYRNYQTIEEKDLQNDLSRFISAKIPGKSFKLRRFNVKGNNRFEGGKLTYRLIDPINAQYKGMINILVRVMVGNKEAGKLFLSAWIDRFEKVVCASHTIVDNQIIDRDDLYYRTVNISRASINLVFNMEDVIGKKAKYRIFKDNTIKTTVLDIPAIIHRGDNVKIMAQIGALVVYTKGVAKDDGAKGEKIDVMNLDSKKRIKGIVYNKTTVIVPM